MLLIRKNNHGPQVLDVQQRLGSLGYQIPSEERGGEFGDGTLAAVRTFQQARGLIVDGIVGPDTWRELVEASWRLGDRVLYLRAPMMRGDDVRELQDALTTMGFDVGRIDGIFGPQTQNALREFQRNYGLPDDGILAADTVRAFKGLPRIAGDTPASGVRERIRRRSLPLPGARIVIDPGHGAADRGNVGPSGVDEGAICFAICRQIEAALAAAGMQVFLTRRDDSSPDDSERAALANALDADLHLSIHLGSGDPEVHGAAAYYFGHERFRSEAGARLAEVLLEHVCALGLTDGRTHPKRFPILRETRMPAVVLEPGYITNAEDEKRLTDPGFQTELAAAVAAAVRAYATEGV